LSAHADQSEILRWLSEFQRPPTACYLVHGEPTAALALKQKIEAELDWQTHVAQDGEVIPIMKNQEWET
jgi:metallo-beta-lactamase family protein